MFPLGLFYSLFVVTVLAFLPLLRCVMNSNHTFKPWYSQGKEDVISSEVCY